MNKLLEQIVSRFDVSEGFDVTNPATDEKIIRLKNNTKEETAHAIDNVFSAQKSWQRQTAKQRSVILRKWFDLLIKNTEEIAEIITIESGKPLAEAKAEVVYAAGFVEWFSEKAKRIDGKIISSPFPETQIRVTYDPVGVVAAVAPWNFPLAMITRKIAPALAAGCGAIAKPSEFTPLATYAAKILAEDAGIPTDLFQVVCNIDAKEIGGEFTTNEKVKKITFTGSTNVGKLLMSQAAQSVKKVSLELGGNAPFIIFDSADVNVAVTALMSSKFRNAGQVCIAPNRIFVQKGIKEKFLEKLKESVNGIKLGNGLDKDVSMGPLINQQAIEKIQNHISDAVEKGATILVGGQKHKLGGTFFEPTIIDNMKENMLTSCEEIFGPIVNIFTFDTEEEAIYKANNTPYGLASYFFSNDAKQIERVRASIESGMVGINFGILSTEAAPFGGVKESGLGREGSDEGIYEFLEAKYSMQSFS